MTSLPVLSCDGCGLCCSTQGTPPFTYLEGDSPPHNLKWDILEHADRYDQSLPCIWYDTETKRCVHYEHRPEACRTAVVPGDEYCLEFRKKGGLA